ncbi:hypothetical protein [Streptomyces boninensis]|uniref:hypothetical protein n=1 Tax=Streptomyces boninensis TaxID=2039455 RepID=UPI003B2126CF
MRSYVSGHQAVSAEDFAELALGTPPELWLGVPNESPAERAARLDAARDILAEWPELHERVSHLTTGALEVNAPKLAEVIAIPRPAQRRLRPRKGAAA